MNLTKLNLWVAVAGTAVLALFAFSVWFFLFRSTATLQTNSPTPTAPYFGTIEDVSVAGGNGSGTTGVNGTQPINTTTTGKQKIFQISTTPVVGATLIQTLHPTTTIARFIRQDDGHVFDVPLGVSG